MEGLFFLIVIFVVVPVVVGVLSQAAARREARRDLVRAVRERLLKNPGMSVEREGETEIPFDLAGRRARIRIPDEGGRTLVEVGEPSLGGRRLHVFGSGGPGAAHEEKDDQLVGDPVFDRAWVVQGDLAPRIFSPESRADVVAAVHALRTRVDPCVEIAGGRLRVGLGQAPGSELTVRDLLRAARAVLDASSAGPTDGVLWVEERHDAPAVCQVCGDERGGPRVLCRSCRTPHHRECWDYAGRCSTFGCGERSSLRA